MTKLDPEALTSASYHEPESITAETLRDIDAGFAEAPRAFFTVLHNVGRTNRPALDLFRRKFADHPEAAMDAVYYICTNDPDLLDAGFVALIAKHVPADAVHGFMAFQYILHRRPELIVLPVVEAAITHLRLCVNQAFYFIRELAKARPDFTPHCTLALFECVVHAEQGWLRQEMMADIVTVAARSHVRMSLAAALHEPPAVGSHRARVLMAILFRQKLRARQRALFDALQHAAPWIAVWDFFLFLIDASDPKRISSRHAEDFLEASYRLSLLVTPYEYEELLAKKLDFREAPSAPFPADAAFLDEDPALRELMRKASALAGNLKQPLKLAPLQAYRGRFDDAKRERQAVSKLLRGATTRRRKKLEARKDTLAKRMEPGPGPTRKEQRELAKKIADALRAESVGMALASVRDAMSGAYHMCVRDVLGPDADPSKIDPAILPAFLYFPKVSHMPNNRAYLARLIEDRLAGRAPTWMRTEPAAAAWAQRVEEGCPGVKLDRWRAEFAKEYAYHPRDAARERKARIEQDLEETRALLGIESGDEKDLRERIEKLKEKPGDIAHDAIEEAATNLERIRMLRQMTDSDYEGKVRFEVETDPFRVLFMGEYGFASCLSLRGAYVWSAVSNAIDIDKAIVWAKDEGGNIVGRRLIALTPQGVTSYATYANRHGLGLDRFFESFIGDYAKHCGTKRVKGVKSGPLLSDSWYDDRVL